ncbi:MAG: citrate/2-methylcitrate synthase [Halanaerobiaceae bacterium]
MADEKKTIKKIYEHLLEIEDQEIQEKYTRIILTLLEKGYFPGLAGIPVVKSRVSRVDGKNGVLTYRGYNATELAEKCSYEDVCFLLLHEDLPLPDERKKLCAQFMKNKEIAPSVASAIVAMDDNLHPMNMLSAGVLMLQGADDDPMDVENYKKNMKKSIQLIAKFPTIIGTFRNNDPDYAAGEDFDFFAEYILYSFNPELAHKKEWAKMFEELLILHADHTLNNSTFSARAVGSAQASLYSSISSAINSLSGPLHGGANERVVRMLDEIDSPDDVEEYVDQKLKRGEKIMGVGHRVYRTYDPRAIYIKEKMLPDIFNGKSVSASGVDDELREQYEIAQKLEEVVLDRLGSKKIYPNVDFWSGLVLKAMGIKPSFFTTIFALGRIMGWCSHWVEHMEVTNKIYRPTQLYDGFEERELVISPRIVNHD